MKRRETFSNRLGFLLMTAGCAIGLGNIWRFPFITGQCGGGAFVLLYLACLALFGFPLMMMELAIGRAGKQTLPNALYHLRSKKNAFRWEIPGFFFFLGNFVLLMFYTVVTGWLIAYAGYSIFGVIPDDTEHFFNAFLASSARQIVFMLIAVLLTVAACSGGVRASVERAIKWMMGGLFLLMLLLGVKALTLPGAADGIRFFLYPDLSNWHGARFWNTLHMAMAQAFFTLSIGIGSVALCGSYLARERTLPGESVWIIALDTFVAFAAGLIIFPCCATYDVPMASGPSLIFMVLPKAFSGMGVVGRVWEMLFFILLAIAALSTLIAVFENLVAFGMENFHLKRKTSCAFFGIALAVASLPCIFGFNLWRNFHPFGNESTVLDLEDFIVSDNLLLLGAIYLLFFCFFGWGKEKLFAEINTGRGWKISPKCAFYFCWIIPLAVFALWVVGMIRKFC